MSCAVKLSPDDIFLEQLQLTINQRTAAREGIVCKVRTQDPENFDEEVKSLGIEYLSGDATDEDELQRLQETSLVTISLYPVEQETLRLDLL